MSREENKVTQNEKRKNYMGFHIPKIWQILKHFVKNSWNMKLLFLKSDFCIQMLFDVFIQDIELTTQHSQ